MWGHTVGKSVKINAENEKTKTKALESCIFSQLDLGYHLKELDGSLEAYIGIMVERGTPGSAPGSDIRETASQMGIIQGQNSIYRSRLS